MSRDMPTHVRMMIPAHTSVLVETSAYEFDPSRSPIAFLWRWLWSLLRWAGVLQIHMGMARVVTYSDIQARPLRDAMLSSIDRLYRIDREPEMIIMGAADWAEFTKNAHPDDLFSYELGPFGYRDRNLFNLKLYVVPWIRGWVVI